MNDEIRILFKYADKGIHCYYQGDRGFLDKIAQNITQIIPFERPDMVIPLGDKVLIIEHFEFDASSFNRKGSADKRKLAERDRKFNNVINEQGIGDKPVTLTTPVDCKYSLQNYISNFRRGFDNHLENISEYKIHLVEENLAKYTDDIITCFFIVDTTPLGCYFLDDGAPKAFNFLQVADCIDTVSSAKEVDYVFCGFTAGSNNILSFMSNCDEAVGLFKQENIVNFEEKEFFSFEPQETRFCVKVDT